MIIKLTLLILLGLVNTTHASSYHVPSEVALLPVGDYLADLPKVYYGDKPSIQKLSDRVYWIGIEGYSTVFLVGDKGVMIFDAFSQGKAEKVIAAIKSFTKKPITSLFYTHYHIDDLGDAGEYVTNAKNNDHELIVVASELTANQVIRYKGKIPEVNIIINEPIDSYQFEGVELQFVTPKYSGHTQDNTMVYFPSEKVILYQDTVNPDQLPFLDFAITQNMQNYERNLNMMLNLDWNYFVGGHANIGSKKDVLFVLEYIKDIKSYLQETIPEVNFTDAAGDAGSEAGMFKNYRDVVIKKVKVKLNDKYTKYYAYEDVVEGHIAKIFYDYFLY